MDEFFEPNRRKYYESLGETQTRVLPCIWKAPEVELKELMSHLRYTFLGEHSTLSVIISAGFSKVKEEKLLHVLRTHKATIGWTLADIKGISSSFCIHQILMEEDHLLVVEHQRRLNPAMKEVVRKEILKWLDVEVIYPIWIVRG